MRGCRYGRGPAPDHRGRAADCCRPFNSVGKQIFRGWQTARRYRHAAGKFHLLLPLDDQPFSQRDLDAGALVIQSPIILASVQNADLVHGPVYEYGFTVYISSRHCAPGAAVV
jgi:hypothetical protein